MLTTSISIAAEANGTDLGGCLIVSGFIAFVCICGWLLRVFALRETNNRPKAIFLKGGSVFMFVFGGLFSIFILVLFVLFYVKGGPSGAAKLTSTSLPVSANATRPPNLVLTTMVITSAVFALAGWVLRLMANRYTENPHIARIVKMVSSSLFAATVLLIFFVVFVLCR